MPPTLPLNSDVEKDSTTAPAGLGRAPAARIPELDGLRGLAILLVICCHYVANSEHGGLSFWPRQLLGAFAPGWSGVDLFFVLSGFLIGGILIDARNSPNYFRAFYARRICRILPVYYVWIAIYAALIAGSRWILPLREYVGKNEVLQIPIQLFFLQNLQFGLSPFSWIWLGVTWSLAVEEQFYLVAPPLLRFLSRRWIAAALVAVIGLAPVLRFLVGNYWFPGTVAATFWMPCRADALAWGILLAIAWRERWFRHYLEDHPSLLRRGVFGLFLGVCGLGWWLAHPVGTVTETIGYSWLAMFFSGLTLLVLTQTGTWVASMMRWTFLRKLGTISYCVYIVHNTVNQLAHRVFLRAAPEIYNLQGAGVTLLALLLTLGVASFSWRYLEKPLIRRGHRYEY